MYWVINNLIELKTLVHSVQLAHFYLDPAEISCNLLFYSFNCQFSVSTTCQTRRSMYIYMNKATIFPFIALVPFSFAFDNSDQNGFLLLPVWETTFSFSLRQITHAFLPPKVVKFTQISHNANLYTSMIVFINWFQFIYFFLLLNNKSLEHRTHILSFQ